MDRWRTHLGRHDMASTPTVAVLGTGRMGLPMAMNLVRAGFSLRVWNRTADRTRTLAAAGATPAATPAEAVRRATATLTWFLPRRCCRTAGAGHADDDLAAVYAGAETP